MEMHKALGESNRRESAVRSVANRMGQPSLVRIDCPYPLLFSGLVHALDGTQLRYWRGPLEANSPHIVVLWAEDTDNLPARVERIRESNRGASVLVLGLNEDMQLALTGLRSGATGFIHAKMKPEQIARAIAVAAKGEIVAPRGLIEYMLTTPPADKPELGTLKPRQREILELVTEGLSNAQIASKLYLTESTIKQHLRAAYKILGVKNRTEAASLFRGIEA